MKSRRPSRPAPPKNISKPLRRVTDLFLVSADGYSGEQIELFGDVLERLIKTIEIRALADVSARIALAEMSTQLASVKQAPPAVIRRLAQNDEISIARPGADRIGAADGRRIWSNSRRPRASSICSRSPGAGG